MMTNYKNGDILVTKKDNMPFIYRESSNHDGIYSYGGCFEGAIGTCFSPSEGKTFWTHFDDVRGLASLEETILLKSKMKEAMGTQDLVDDFFRMIEEESNALSIKNVNGFKVLVHCKDEDGIDREMYIYLRRVLSFEKWDELCEKRGYAIIYMESDYQVSVLKDSYDVLLKKWLEL